MKSKFPKKQMVPDISYPITETKTFQFGDVTVYHDISDTRSHFMHRLRYSTATGISSGLWRPYNGLARAGAYAAHVGYYEGTLPDTPFQIQVGKKVQ